MAIVSHPSHPSSVQHSSVWSLLVLAMSVFLLALVLVLTLIPLKRAVDTDGAPEARDAPEADEEAPPPPTNNFVIDDLSTLPPDLRQFMEEHFCVIATPFTSIDAAACLAEATSDLACWTARCHEKQPGSFYWSDAWADSWSFAPDGPVMKAFGAILASVPGYTADCGWEVELKLAGRNAGAAHKPHWDINADTKNPFKLRMVVSLYEGDIDFYMRADGGESYKIRHTYKHLRGYVFTGTAGQEPRKHGVATRQSPQLTFFVTIYKGNQSCPVPSISQLASHYSTFPHHQEPPPPAPLPTTEPFCSSRPGMYTPSSINGKRRALARMGTGQQGVLHSTVHSTVEAIAERDKAILERDKAIAERNEAKAELDRARANWSIVIAEPDNKAIAARDKAIRERDLATVERIKATLERDKAIAQMNEVVATLNRVAIELSKAKAERDSARAPLQAMNQQARMTASHREGLC